MPSNYYYFVISRRARGSFLAKKAPGRPRKSSKDVSILPGVNTVLASDESFVLPVKKAVPILEGEIIRLRRTSERLGSDSDSEIDIDGSDDESDHIGPPQSQAKVIKTDVQSPLSPGDSASSSTAENERQDSQTSETVKSTPLSLHSEPPVNYAHEDKSECESSETDSKLQEPRSSDTETQQPIFTFPPPTQERIVDLSIITDEEKTIHWDFFEGRPSKTPERYMKIRNSIIHEWRRVKPRFLTKTSVRPSLKNCGDVNCISRVHAYLELIGAINFGCGKSIYL